jgi:hypothetical protein
MRGPGALAFTLTVAVLGCAQRSEAPATSQSSAAAPAATSESPKPSSATDQSPTPTSGAQGDGSPSELEQKKAELERQLENAKDDATKHEIELQLKAAKERGGGGPAVPPKPHDGSCDPADPLCLDSTEPHKNKRKAPMLASTKSLTDRLSSSQLEQVVSDNIEKLVPCTKTDATLNVHATVAPEGNVLEASSDTSSPDDAKMRDCVVKVLKRLSFPKAQGIHPSPVTFELSLKPQDI